MCAVDEQATEITVPSFADSSETRLSTGRVLSRSSPSHAANSLPLRNMFGFSTVAAIAVAMIGPIPGMVARRWLHRVALVPRDNLRLEPSDPRLSIFDLVDDHLQHLTGNIRYTPVRLVHANRNQLVTLCRP